MDTVQPNPDLKLVPEAPSKPEPRVVDVVRELQRRVGGNLQEAAKALSLMLANAEMTNDPNVATYLVEFDMFIRHAGYVAQDAAFACVQGPKSSAQIAEAQLLAKEEAPK